MTSPQMGGARRGWVVLSAVSVGTFMATLNTRIVNISLPVIAGDFGVGVSEVEWVVISYLLATGTLLLAFGRLGEVAGYRRVYLVGLAVFAAAGALCGLSGGLGSMVLLRALQGVGAAAVQAVGPAIVTAAFPPSRLGRALGVNAMSVSFGLALGPTLGGLIAEWLSWRWIFFLNLPLGLVGLPWSWRVLPRYGRGEGQRFDPAGALLAGGMLLCLLLALAEGGGWGWLSPLTLGLFAAAAAFAAAFVFAELRSPQPLFDLRLFAIRAFSAGNVSLLVTFVALLSATFLMPFFLQRGQGLSALQAGLLMTPLSLTTLVVSPFSGALSDRIGSRLLASSGLACAALGLFLLTQLDAGSGGLDVVWRLVVIGFGMGLFNSPNQSSILGSVPRLRLGTASGMIAQMRITGQMLGVATSSAILASRLQHHLRNLPPEAPRGEALILAIHDAFYFAAAVCVLGVAASLVRGSRLGARG
jgi:EmrB/QacA subfamily drug resistance transporter